MSELSKLVKTGLGTMSMLTCKDNELLATVAVIKNTDDDHGKGLYRVCIYDGPAHGKVAYAYDMEDLGEKSYELMKLRGMV